VGTRQVTNLPYALGRPEHSARNRYNLAEAEVEFRKAVRLEPNNAEYHHNLGRTLYSQGRYAEAEAEYREAVRLEPKDTLYRDSLDNVVNLRRAKTQVSRIEENKERIAQERKNETPSNPGEVIIPTRLMFDWQMFMLNTNGRVAFFTNQKNPLRGLEDIKNPEKEVAIGDLSFERPLRTLLGAMGFADKDFLVVGTGFYPTLFYELGSLKLFLAPNRPELEKEILEKGSGLRVKFIQK
jgi:tetratricopeptide (TPR) repeat protein